MRHWIIRRQLRRFLEEGGAMPEALEAHLRACPSCRALHADHTLLIDELESTASTQFQEPSPFLRSRIMAEIRRGESRIETAPTSWNWPALGFAGASLCLLALMLSQVSKTPDPAPREDSLTELVMVFTPGANQALERQFEALTEPSPLEEELKAVQDDVRASLQFLSGNVLEPALTSLAESSAPKQPQ